jgi:hypothetical protein
LLQFFRQWDSLLKETKLIGTTIVGHKSKDIIEVNCDPAVTVNSPVYLSGAIVYPAVSDVAHPEKAEVLGFCIQKVSSSVALVQKNGGLSLTGQTPGKKWLGTDGSLVDNITGLAVIKYLGYVDNNDVFYIEVQDNAVVKDI